MSSLLAGLLGAILATNQTAAVVRLVAQQTGVKVPVPAAAAATDPVEKDYLALLSADDIAQAEVDQWILSTQADESPSGDVSRATLKARIEQRFAPVHKAYEDFLRRHPEHAKARLAYGSFLGDIGKEAEARGHWEKARELDPSNPAVWNNLANYYGHNGPVTNAFAYYTKAIELNPNEPVYYQNFATTVFLFRADAKQFYKIDEQAVFDRALDLYRKAVKLDPTNFPLLTDLAQTYYGIKPPRHSEALAAWQDAVKAASDDFEREGVYLHLARVHIGAGQFPQARTNLSLVRDARYDVLKNRLTRSLEEKQNRAQTNEPPAAVAAPPSGAGANTPVKERATP